MSYDIYLTDPVTHETLHTEANHDLTGGNYVIGGTTEMWLNITYNYGKYYYEHIDNDEGIRKIYGMTGAESLPLLEKAINELGNDVSSDYWESTEGNAKEALCKLKAFAQLRPDGIWDGD